MVKWGQFAQTRWNRANPRNRIRLVIGDTQLPDTAQAFRVAEGFAANEQMLVVVGPAGSQEIEVSTAPFRRAGLANISGTATRTDLTTSGTRRGFFFRTVPNDEQQASRAVGYMRGTLQANRIVVIDAQNSYSVGLSDAVSVYSGAAGVTAQRESVNEATVTDFSSLVARIPNNTQVVYVPWQMAAKAQLFGQQLRASGRNATLFGGDGLYAPDDFKIPGSYVTGFPVAANHPVVRAYQSGPGGGRTDLFGLPATSRSTSPLVRSRRHARTGRRLGRRCGASSTRRTSRRRSRCSGSRSGSSRRGKGSSGPETCGLHLPTSSTASTTAAST